MHKVLTCAENPIYHLAIYKKHARDAGYNNHRMHYIYFMAIQVGNVNSADSEKSKY